MPDQPSLAGKAPLSGDPGPQPVPAGSQRNAFQPASVMGAPHLQAPHPTGPPPSVPVGSMAGQHLSPPTSPDPFSRTIDLPSGGVFYGDGMRQATIRPMRGEEELNIAGTSDVGIDRSRTMREMVARCVQLYGDTALEELLVLDYSAITLHLLAATRGSDEINADASAGCGKNACPLATQKITLLSLPSVHLRRKADAETEEDEIDPIIAAAMRTEAKLSAEAAGKPEAWGFGRKLRSVGQSYREPFEAKLPGGYVVGWRHLRVKDQIAAEEFVLETGATLETDVKSALGSYLAARCITSINGQPVATVMALQWWRKAPGPLLRKLREEQNKHTFGYEFRPQFRCPRSECRKEVAVTLPKDGSLFRSGSGS